jgi:hypothetical protein
LVRLGASASTTTSGKSPRNSAANCRHAPQGIAPPLDATAIAANCTSPAATAVERATRSAQSVKP